MGPRGRLVREYPDHPSTVADIDWRPGGSELTSAAYGGVHVWSPDAAEPVRRFEWKGSVLALAWIAGRQVHRHRRPGLDGAFLDRRHRPGPADVRLPDEGARTGLGPEQPLPGDRRRCQVTVWDCSGKGPEGTTPLQLAGHAKDSTVNALAFQRGGPLLASGGGDGKVVLWRPEGGKRPLADTKFAAGVAQVVWSGRDDRLAVGTEAGEVAVYGA